MAKNNTTGEQLTIAGTVPPVPANGLWEIIEELQSTPAKTHIGVVMIDAQYVRHETDTGDRMPVVRIRQIEFPTDTDDMKLLSKLLDRLQSERTGQMTLMEPDPE